MGGRTCKEPVGTQEEEDPLLYVPTKSDRYAQKSTDRYNRPTPPVQLVHPEKTTLFRTLASGRAGRAVQPLRQLVVPDLPIQLVCYRSTTGPGQKENGYRPMVGPVGGRYNRSPET